MRDLNLLLDQLKSVIGYIQSSMSYSKTPKTDQKVIEDLRDIIFEVEAEIERREKLNLPAEVSNAS